MKMIRISEKGQIAIPKEIREEVGLNRGDELILIEQNGKIFLQKTQKVMEEAEEDFKDIDRLTEVSLREAWADDEDDEHWESYLKE